MNATPVSGRLLGIPTIPFNATNGSYPLRCLKSVIVDSRYASAVDNEGWTLIPPTLEEFAETFAADLNSQFGFSLPVKRANSAQPDSIFLTVNNSTTYRDAAGRPTSEGYSLSVSKAGVVIQGASPLGAWWGTRTVLQLALLSKSNDSLTIPYGSGTDAPGWGTRGIMLDAARHYFPPAFMKELCAYLSFFKQNVFHVHLSDNLYANPNYTYEETMSLYAAFRPNSVCSSRLDLPWLVDLLTKNDHSPTQLLQVLTSATTNLTIKMTLTTCRTRAHNVV